MRPKFVRFVLVGLTATVVTYSVLIFGVEVLQVSAVTASMVGYAAGIVVNYLLNYSFTFGSEERHAIVLPRFLAVMAAGMALNAGIMIAGIEWAGLHYMLAQLLAVGVVLVWSFTANRLWTFARQDLAQLKDD